MTDDRWQALEERLNRETLWRREDIHEAVGIARAIGLRPDQVLLLALQLQRASAEFAASMAAVATTLGGEAEANSTR